MSNTIVHEGKGITFVGPDVSVFHVGKECCITVRLGEEFKNSVAGGAYSTSKMSPHVHVHLTANGCTQSPRSRSHFVRHATDFAFLITPNEVGPTVIEAEVIHQTQRVGYATLEITVQK